MKSEMTTAYAFLPRILNPGERYDSMDLITTFKSVDDALSTNSIDDDRFLTEIRCDDKGPDLHSKHLIYSFTMIKYLSFDDLLTPYPSFNGNETYYIETEDVTDDVKIHIIERFDVYSNKNPRRTNASIIDYALSSDNPDIRMALLWNRSLCNDYSKRNIILSILSHDMNTDIRKLALEKLQTMKGQTL